MTIRKAASTAAGTMPAGTFAPHCCVILSVDTARNSGVAIYARGELHQLGHARAVASALASSRAPMPRRLSSGLTTIMPKCTLRAPTTAAAAAAAAAPPAATLAAGPQWSPDACGDPAPPPPSGSAMHRGLGACK